MRSGLLYNFKPKGLLQYYCPCSLENWHVDDIHDAFQHCITQRGLGEMITWSRLNKAINTIVKIHVLY